MLILEDRLDEEPAILARINAGERVDHFETIRRRGEAFVEQSTTLFTLLSSLLSPFEDKEGGRWRLHGEDAQISADRVTSLALLVHEFTTNAVIWPASG